MMGEINMNKQALKSLQVDRIGPDQYDNLDGMMKW